MRALAKLARIVSRPHPLWFLLAYLAAIPVFGMLYFSLAPNDLRTEFVGGETEVEPSTVSIEAMLEGALRRSFKNQSGEKFMVADRELNLDRLRDSLHVDNASVRDGTMMSFRVRANAIGIFDFEGERQLGWSFVVSIPELSNSAILQPSSVVFYRFPVADFSKYPSPLKEQTEKLFSLAFGLENYGFGMRAPALALTYVEDLQLRRYFDGIRDDRDAVGTSVWHGMYLSAVVITTLGPRDVVPTNLVAKTLVASETILGVVFVALFLNSIAYRASRRGD